MQVMRLWVLCVCFVVLSQALGIKCCVREEREALLNIKTYFHKSFNESLRIMKLLSSWVIDSNSDCCTWNRVKCHPFSGRVSKLSLQALGTRQYYGNVSLDFSMFQNFKELTSLNFSGGPFQSMKNTAVLGNLSNLEVLILKDNYLEGSLPLHEICKLKKIRVLDFSNNEFNGSLHKCLANLTSLQALDLSFNDLTGEIPASAIASLTSLEYFSAQYNDFRGIFPLSSFANNSRLKVLSLHQMWDSESYQVNTESEGLPWIPLFQLEVLDIGNCKVNAPSGNLPSFLLYQHDLHYLDLSYNDLVGVFPNWLLLNNTNLRSLSLHHNKFIGAFEFPADDIHRPPPHPLINLWISYNKMEGELPKNIDLMFPNLEYLCVSGNGLYGSIPPSIGNMSKLVGLDMSRNKFFGEVPDSLWAGCSSLEYLILSHNNLEGKLFASHMNSSSLIGLFLDNNYLNGTLEHGIWHLPQLGALYISNNSFWGMIPPFISNHSYLYQINLSRNNFTGTLPTEFCELDLSYLHLSHNKFSGSIPVCYFNSSLSSLQLQGNSLVGPIPTLIKSHVYLSTLDLRDNKLSGVIPDWILNGTGFLNALLLGGNKFHGQLLDQLCQLKDMRFLDLSRNKFTGNIPTCFNNVLFGSIPHGIIWYSNSLLSSSDSSYYYNPLHLQLFVDSGYDMTEVADEIDFTTKNLLLPYEGSILKFMSGIDLSSNQLTGKIPHEIGYLKSLHALNLSHNHLHGSIPISFHNLSTIESIDLSNNFLNGEIPIQLQNLNYLSVFNVSFNNLSGTVPNGRQFSTFDDSCFKGNQYLVRHNNNKDNSAYVPPPPSLNNDTKEDESIIDFTSFIWSFCACYVAVLVVIATVLWINPYWRRLWFYYVETCLYRCLYPYLKDAFW